MNLALIVATCLAIAASSTVSASERLDAGRAAYEKVCAGCHETGVDGAPLTGDASAWAARSHLWDAVLTRHATDGYIRMPARGGEDDLSDYQVHVAAEYMLSITHPGMPAD